MRSCLAERARRSTTLDSWKPFRKSKSAGRLTLGLVVACWGKCLISLRVECLFRMIGMRPKSDKLAGLCRSLVSKLVRLTVPFVASASGFGCG